MDTGIVDFNTYCSRLRADSVVGSVPVRELEVREIALSRRRFQTVSSSVTHSRNAKRESHSDLEAQLLRANTRSCVVFRRSTCKDLRDMGVSDVACNSEPRAGARIADIPVRALSPRGATGCRVKAGQCGALTRWNSSYRRVCNHRRRQQRNYRHGDAGGGAMGQEATSRRRTNQSWIGALSSAVVSSQRPRRVCKRRHIRCMKSVSSLWVCTNPWVRQWRPLGDMHRPRRAKTGKARQQLKST